MTEHERAMLLSVRPRYAESIISGAKRAELRRQRPAAGPGTPVIIYATRPVAAVIGTARIDRVCDGSPAGIWAEFHDEIGITRDEFDLYLHGASSAYLLLLSSAERLPSPLALDDMREGTIFQPPRSYRYLNYASLHTLVNGHPGAQRLLSLLPTGNPANRQSSLRASAPPGG